MSLLTGTVDKGIYNNWAIDQLCHTISSKRSVLFLFIFICFIVSRSDRGIIGSLEKIYSKYVNKLESEDVHTSGCPLCHRTFESNRQIAALVTEVSKITNLEIVDVPPVN